MSTFRGIVSEFPNIRIDFFRRADGHPPPLACFLSHVHSDHLMGLESLKAPFVYCSPATKAIILRLEKYPSRMNFAKGILETRRQTYKHLAKILKTIPSDVPTVIELSPGKTLTVTLFDANHCVGAVMFLIEGDGKSILYTGDIRSEDWWLKALSHHPVMLPYAKGIKILDNIYLDTTFATKDKLYRNFPSKADGVAELLRKVSLYSEDTTFYFHSWTFGYESVWVALSALFKSRVHLDIYRWTLYQALLQSKVGPECAEANYLCGFTLGNHFIHGCLTNTPDTRIHSCERGTGCQGLRKTSRVVNIIPVVTRRIDGIDVHELGIGGGKGDLDQVQEVDVQDQHAVTRLSKLCTERIEDPLTLKKVQTMLETCAKSRSARMRLDSHIHGLGIRDVAAETELTSLVDELAKLVNRSPPTTGQNSHTSNLTSADILPDVVTFPYSRHSSYFELRALVKMFAPMEVFPCTVDELNWNRKISMESLFGDLCSGTNFKHDNEMLSQKHSRDAQHSQHSCESQETQLSELPHHGRSDSQPSDGSFLSRALAEYPVTAHLAEHQEAAISHEDSLYNTLNTAAETCQVDTDVGSSQLADVSGAPSADVAKDTHESIVISPPPIKRKLRESLDDRSCHKLLKMARERSVSQWAYQDAGRGDWHEFGGLTCAKSAESQELTYSDSE